MRFLEYFAHFDWGQYCLTIRGPVPKSELAQVANPSVSAPTLISRGIQFGSIQTPLNYRGISLIRNAQLPRTSIGP